jgi:WD40 repeat protein
MDFHLLLKAYSDFGKYILKIAILVFLFAPIGYGIGLIADKQELFQNFDYYTLEAYGKMMGFSIFLEAPGLIGLIFIVLSSVIFIIPWWKELPFVSFLRDLSIVLFFGSFSLILFLETSYPDENAAISFLHFDYLALSALFAIYFVMAMSNFGGVFDETRAALKSLFYILAFSAIASIPLLIQSNFSFYSFYVYFIYVSMVYIVSFMVKIVLHPEDIVTVNLDASSLSKTDLKRLGFALLMLLVVVPLLGLGWSLLVLILVFLVSLIIPVSLHVSIPFMVLFAYVVLPSAFILNLAKHDIPGLLIFILAVAKDVSSYVGKVFNQGKIHHFEYERLKTNFLFRIIKDFNCNPDDKFSLAFVIKGIVIFTLFFTVTLLSNENDEKIYSDATTLNHGDIFYDSERDTFIFTLQDTHLLDDSILRENIKKKLIDTENNATNLADKADSIQNQYIDLLNSANRVVCLHKLPGDLFFLFTTGNMLFAIQKERGKTIDSVMVQLPETWPFKCPEFIVSGNKKMICFYTDRTYYLFNHKGNLISEAEAPGRFIKLVMDNEGGKIALGNSIGYVAVLDTSGRLINKDRPFDSKVTALAFSPEGNDITAGSAQSVACIIQKQGNKQIILKHWSLKSALYSFFNKSGKSVKKIVYSNNGNFILLQSDYLISLWDKNGQCISKFSGHSGEIRHVAFSDDGKYIISNGKDNYFIIRDSVGKFLYNVPVNQNYISRFVFDEAKKLLITVTGYGKISIYQIQDKQ